MREFYKEKLDNGLTVLFENRDLPLVSSAVAIKRGFGMESIKEKGISHLIEHLVHQGTKNRNHKEIAHEVEKKGGVINAFTDEEVTAFWNKMPSRHFSTGISIVSDLALNPVFEEEFFEREKRVVLEEIKMRKDNPKYYVLEKLKELLYEKPFGISGTGTLESVRGIDREDLLEYYNQKYKGSEMFLCVVGDTSMSKVKEFGEKFPKMEGNGEVIEPVKINGSEVESREGIAQANLAIGYHTSTLEEKERYAWDIFNSILGKGMSSRLFEEIREKRGLAYDVRSFLDRGKNYGYGCIYVGTTKDNVKKCKKLALKEIKKLKDLEKADLEEAKEQVIGLREVGSEESVNVMHNLIEEEAAGDAKKFYEYEEKIKEVGLKDVQDLAKLNNYSSIILKPKK